MLIVPNRSDVDRVERELLGAAPAPARRLDRHVRRPLRAHRVRRGRRRPVARRTRSARCSCAASSRTAELDGLSRSAAHRRASPTRSSERSTSSRRGCSTPNDARRRPRRRCTPPTGTSSTGSSRWDRDLLRRHAVERLRADLDAWHGEPVFAYGFEDLTGAEWALLEALAGRAEVDGLAAVRAGPTGLRVAAAHGRGPRRPRRRRIEELPPRYGAVAPPALAHLERTLFADEARRRRRRSTARCASSRAPARRGTLELVGEELLDAAPRRHAAGADRRSSPGASSAWRGAARDGARLARRSRTRVDGDAAARADAVRPRARRAAALRVARRDAPRPLPLPALAVLGARARGRSTSSRGGCAGARSRRPSASSRRPRGCAAAPLPGARRAARRPPIRSTAVRELARADAARRVRARRRRRPARRRGSTCARTRRCARLLDELERWRELTGEPRREDVLAALERADAAPAARRRAGPRRRRRPAPRAHAPLRRRLRARARGGQPAAARAGVAVPRRRARRGARRARRPAERPDPVSRDRYLFYTACTRALGAALPRPRGGDRRRQPARAEPVLGGGRRRVFDAERRAPLDAPAAALGADVAARGRRRPSASGCARSPSSRVERPRRRADALARANGWERRLERAVARLPRVRRGSRIRSCSSSSARGRRSTSPSSSGSPTAPRPGSSSASSTRRRSTPRWTRSCAARVAHSALYKFFARLPEGARRRAARAAARRGGDRAHARAASTRRSRRRADGADRDAGARARPDAVARPRGVRARRSASRELPLVPRRFEVSFGSERAAPELQRGLELGDGPDALGEDRPHRRRPVRRARDRPGLQVGQARALGEADRERAAAPDPALHARAARPRRARAARRPLPAARRRAASRAASCAAPRRRRCPATSQNDYLDEEAFWGARRVGARHAARDSARRIRDGDVRHDPKGGECPAWCDLWPMCRVERA